MANVFVPLPSPAGNGVGAAVDVSTLGSPKTIIVDGTFSAAITIEMSNQLVPTSFALVAYLDAPGEVTVPLAARHMRVRVSGYGGGAPDVRVGADQVDAGFATLVVPPAPGPGASVDTSAVPGLRTVQVGGTFDGSLIIEISNDGVNWVQHLSFDRPGQQTAEFVSSFMRARRTAVGGAPTVNVAGVPQGGGGTGSIASNVLIPQGSGAENVRYWRSFGDDFLGTGTLANPYRTLRRADLDVPEFIDVAKQGRWRLNGDGAGIETSAVPIVIRHFSSDPLDFDFAPAFPAFFNLAPLIIEATPTTFDTLTAGEITGQTSEPTTSHITIDTNQSYPLNSLVGKKVVDVFGSSGAVASNTAGPNSSIEVSATFGPLVAPLLIVDLSAGVENNGTSFLGNPAIVIAGGTANVVINGLEIRNTLFAGSFDTPLQIRENPGSVFPSLCDIPGCTVRGSAGTGFFGSPELFACFWDGTAEWQARGCAPRLVNCFFDGAGGAGFAMDGCGTGDGGPMFWFGNIFDGLPAIGAASSGFQTVSALALFLSNCIVRNGSGVGVLGPSRLSALRLRDVDISGCVGDAVSSVGGDVALGTVTSNGGGNGGLGLRLENGAHGRTDGTATVTGALGDFKVGGNAASAGGGAGWAAFTGNETDVAALLPQLCRLFT